MSPEEAKAYRAKKAAERKKAREAEKAATKAARRAEKTSMAAADSKRNKRNQEVAEASVCPGLAGRDSFVSVFFCGLLTAHLADDPLLLAPAEGRQGQAL